MKKILPVIFALHLMATQALQAQCEILRGPVVINEFVAFNTNIATNAIGVYADYVELYNTGNEAFNLQGWFLSDSRGSNGRTKYQFPNVSIPGNGYLIIWCDSEADPFMPGLNAPFNLSSTNGELVVLTNPDSVIVDFVRFAPVEENVAIGRFPNGSGPFTEMLPSFNGPNFNGAQLNMVINEYMASNNATMADETGNFGDWIELFNNDVVPINLSGWMLSDNHNRPDKFVFAQGTTVPPGGYLMVWADNTTDNGPLHAGFALSASGEEVILSRPDTSTVDFFAFGPQTTDISEGRFPNGLGGLIPCMAPTFAAENSGTVSTRIYAQRKEQLFVYPNPANEMLYIKSTHTAIQPVQIFDLSGRLCWQTQLVPGVESINVGHLNVGTYIIHLANQSTLFTKFK